MRGTHNAATSLTNDIRFDAFGQQDFHGGSAPSALPLAWHQSSNYQSDADSSLILLGNRYYDPTIGRFLSPDKVHDGNNWYAYCGNNPLAATDPTGNEAQTINGSGVGSAMFVSMTMGAGPAMDYMAGIDAMFDDLQHNAQVYANKQAQQAQHVDSKHTALANYANGTGKPMYVGIDELPMPSYLDYPDIVATPQVQADLKTGNGTYTVDIPSIRLNFNDNLIGRVVGHIEAQMTIANGGYMITGKLFAYPDFYDFNNDPSRGFIKNEVTNGIRHLYPGGVGFPVIINGSLPISMSGILNK